MSRMMENGHNKIITEFTQFLLLIVLTLVSCAPTKPTTPDAAYIENVEYLKSQAIENWNKRSNKKNAAISTFFLEKAIILEPHNVELKLLLSRAYHFEGYYIESDLELKDSLFIKGAQLAVSIVRQSDLFNKVFETTSGDSMVKVTQAIAVVEKDYVDALYWWAINMARYLAEKSVRDRLEYREMGESLMHRVLALDPDYFYGGPNRYFGAFYSRLPGVELSQSEEHFQKAINDFPDYLGTYVLRARFLHTKSGDREQFRKDLIHVVNADPSNIPDVMAENLFEQKIAEVLLDEENMFFE